MKNRKHTLSADKIPYDQTDEDLRASIVGVLSRKKELTTRQIQAETGIELYDVFRLTARLVNEDVLAERRIDQGHLETGPFTSYFSLKAKGTGQVKKRGMLLPWPAPPSTEP